MISVELHVIGGKHAGQIISLDRKKFLIGRESDCQLRPNSEMVSRHHCIFTVDDFSVRLRDLGSTNGTRVNGESIRKEVVLKSGDHVVVGSLEFNVVVNEVSSTTGTIAAVSEETVVASIDTVSDVTQVEASKIEMPPVDTPLPAPSAAPPEMPPASAGDTTVIAQSAIPPGQIPYQPMMPQQMGYPQMYAPQGYGYPGMPGQMPMYAPQGYPPMPGYPQQQPPPPSAPESPPPSSGDLNVSLPDPSQTGAKPNQPKPVAEEKASGSAPPPQSNKSAADIIQQHMNRRPGG